MCHSFLIFAYVAAQAESIYYMIPSETDVDEKEKPEQGGIMQEKVKPLLKAIENSKIVKLYYKYRNPFMPIGLQIFETYSQISAFYAYASSISARCSASRSLILILVCNNVNTR